MRPATTVTPTTTTLTAAPTYSIPASKIATTPTYAAAPSTTYGYVNSAARANVSLRQGVAYTTAPVTSHPFSQPVNIQTTAKEDSPWGGNCPWQYDKTAFKTFVKTATEVPTSEARRELYGFLAACFLDSDGDRDGLIGADEFDMLIENAAALPRRFGLAPSWVECYGDVAHRTAAREQMFQQMDKHHRGKIGMEEWVEFTMAHIKEKASTMKLDTLDFHHLENAGVEQFVSFLEIAMADRHSEQFKSLYEFLFKTFVESDKDEKGAITFAQFDVLIEDAAKAPRTLGLAPSTAQTYSSEQAKLAARQEEFNQMDFDRSGVVTFDKFLGWALRHIQEKVSGHRAARR